MYSGTITVIQYPKGFLFLLNLFQPAASATPERNAVITIYPNQDEIAKAKSRLIINHTILKIFDNCLANMQAAHATKRLLKH